MKASTLANSISDSLYFKNDTLLNKAGFMRQKIFLDDLLSKLEKDPEPILNKLKDLSRQIVQPKNLFVYMATNVKLLTEK